MTAATAFRFSSLCLIERMRWHHELDGRTETRAIRSPVHHDGRRSKHRVVERLNRR